MLDCQRAALQNDVDDEENYIRSNRARGFPSWQARMAGIGSRSRSAGRYLRIGRSDSQFSPEGDVEIRNGRSRSAGRYLRIGRRSLEETAGGAAIPALHELRKVN